MSKVIRLQNETIEYLEKLKKTYEKIYKEKITSILDENKLIRLACIDAIEKNKEVQKVYEPKQ